jgi:hypothetical protein
MVVLEGGEVAPFLAAAHLDHARAEFEPEHQPPAQHDDRQGRRHRVRAEERDDEPGLEQQALPPEAIEGLPGVHDRQVQRPHEQEHEERHPGRAQLRQAEDDGCRGGGTHEAHEPEHPVAVVPVEHARRLPEAHAPQVGGGGEEAAFARERGELIEGGDERDEEDGGDAPLQYLAREFVVVCPDPFHGLTLEVLWVARSHPALSVGWDLPRRLGRRWRRTVASRLP